MTGPPGVRSSRRLPGQAIAPWRWSGRRGASSRTSRTLGFFYTSRDFGGSSNRVGSASTRLRVDANWFVNAQAAGSLDTGTDGSMVSGAASSAELRRSGRAFNYGLSYLGFSPGFRAPLGFVPRTDMHEVTNDMAYRW